LVSLGVFCMFLGFSTGTNGIISFRKIVYYLKTNVGVSLNFDIQRSLRISLMCRLGKVLPNYAEN